MEPWFEIGPLGVWEGQISHLENALDLVKKMDEIIRLEGPVDKWTDLGMKPIWKVVVKQVEGLKIYNAQKRQQIKAQEERLVTLAEQTRQVVVIQRQIPPLMERMADSLEQFVNLDAPFSLNERVKRVNQVRNTLSDPKVTASEQVRQVLEAYNIEREYGRTIETYEDAIVLDGEEKVVNILRIGRLALLYQLKDQSEAGIWDTETNQWVKVDGYRIPVRDGIRMANKVAPLDLLSVPVKFEGGE